MNVQSWMPLVVLIGAAAGAAGCSARRDALEAQVAQLEREVAVLRASHDRLEDRVASAEIAAHPTAPAPSATAAAAPVAVPAGGGRPGLQVVRLVPEGALVSDAGDGAPADDSAPRPIIRGEGSKLESRMPEGER